MSISWDRGFSVLGGHHLGFLIPGWVIQHSRLFHWIVGPQNHQFSFWNFVSMLPTSWDICVQMKVPVWSPPWCHLEFLLPVRSYSNSNVLFKFSFQGPFQRCITCYIIRCLRQKSKGSPRCIGNVAKSAWYNRRVKFGQFSPFLTARVKFIKSILLAKC